MDEQTKAESPIPALIPASQNSRASAPASQDPSSDGCSPDTASPRESSGSPPLPRRATGPRTKVGTRKSRYNALKKGLFAKAMLLDGESAAQYDALRNGLWEEFPPESASEMEDVEYLVTLYWRRRRIVKGENAEIENLVNFRNYDSHHASVAEAREELRAGETARGMLRHSPKRLVFRYAIEMLGIFRDSLEKYGFHADEDPWLRTKLYELYHDDETLKYLPGYSECPSWVVKKYETAIRLRHDDFLAEICRIISDEIQHFENIEETEVFAEKQSGEYKTIAALNPFRDFVDAIVRVQAHTSREIERTRNRLESARRRRQGQPEPPTVRLKLDE